MNTSKTNRIAIFIFIPAFLIIWAMLFWKCRYGFPSDEALYLLVPVRFINGDIPLIHEWHPTQLSAIWLHPLVAIFLKIAGSTEGIFLAFRYIFTTIWGLSSLFVFFRLRKLSPWAGLFASLIIFIYVPFGEMALYYNTIALMTLICSAVILITAERHKYVQYIAAGILYAVAVTCCPFLIIVFGIAVIYAGVCLVRKDMNLVKVFVFFLIGCVITFIIFASYYMTSVPLGQLVESLPRVLSDRAHPLDLWEKTSSYIMTLVTTPPVIIGTGIFAVTIPLVLYFNSKQARIIGFVAVCFAVVIEQIMFFYMGSLNYINNFMLAPMLIGFYVRIFSHDKKISQVFKIMWIPGLIYTYAIHLSSNIGFSSICSAATIMAVASAIMGVMYVKSLINEEAVKTQDNNKYKLAAIALAIMLCFQVGIELYNRATYVFENVPMSAMDTKIDNGAAKGIISTSNRQFYYACMLYDTSALRADDVDRVLILSPEAWLYIDTNKNVASYTSWSLEIDDQMLDQLDEYYSLYPDKKPDIIYVESYYKDLVPRLESDGYKSEQTLLGGYILE